MLKKLHLILVLFITILIYSCNLINRTSDSLDMIPYLFGNEWGYIDKTGAILINPQFLEATPFVDGAGLVKFNDGKYGYIDKEGKRMINTTYKYATFFSEGLACVVPENGKPQFIDKQGNVKFVVNADCCGIFKEGLAAVKVGEKWGYINTKGKMMITPQFDYVSPFAEGLAAVALVFNEDTEAEEIKIGYINKEGKLEIPYQFKPFSSRDNETITSSSNPYITTEAVNSNKLLLSQSQFSDGLALVSNGNDFGYIDKSGKYVINPQFDKAVKFKNSYAVISQKGMCGYINKEGKIIINPQFEFADYFYSGKARVRSSDGKWGYIDMKGRYVINPQFESSSKFFGDMAFVNIGEKWGMIDEQGKIVVNPQYQNINFDVHSNRYEVVETDYFDATTIVEKFMEGTTAQSFRNLTAQTTLGTLKEIFWKLTSESSYEALSNEVESVTEKAFLDNVKFGFSESIIADYKPVYRTVDRHTYFGKYTEQVFDHYEKIPNNKAPLQKISLTLDFRDMKARKKYEKIFNDIAEALKQKATLTSEDSKNIRILDNKEMRIILSKGKYSTIECEVFFLKNRKTSNAEDNEFAKEGFAEDYGIKDAVAVEDDDE